MRFQFLNRYHQKMSCLACTIMNLPVSIPQQVSSKVQRLIGTLTELMVSIPQQVSSKDWELGRYGGQHHGFQFLNRYHQKRSCESDVSRYEVRFNSSIGIIKRSKTKTRKFGQALVSIPQQVSSKVLDEMTPRFNGTGFNSSRGIIKRRG